MMAERDFPFQRNFRERFNNRRSTLFGQIGRRRVSMVGSSPIAQALERSRYTATSESTKERSKPSTKKVDSKSDSKG